MDNFEPHNAVMFPMQHAQTPLNCRRESKRIDRSVAVTRITPECQTRFGPAADPASPAPLQRLSSDGALTIVGRNGKTDGAPDAMTSERPSRSDFNHRALEVASVSENNSSGSDLVAAVAKELAAQIPVGQVLSPAAVPAGQIVSNIAKTIQLALAPFQFLAAYQDRLRNFIDTELR